MVIMASSVPPWLWRPRITALGAGVSYDATFSQGWMLDAVERFTAGVDNALAHVHSKSHAVVSCYEYDLTSP